MKDKNGNIIQTGDVVEITNAYNKKNNGRYIVTAALGEKFNPSSIYIDLYKLDTWGNPVDCNGSATWPIMIFSAKQQWEIQKEHDWNAENATIEVITDTVDTFKVANYFANQVIKLQDSINFRKENGYPERPQLQNKLDKYFSIAEKYYIKELAFA